MHHKDFWKSDKNEVLTQNNSGTIFKHSFKILGWNNGTLAIEKIVLILFEAIYSNFCWLESKR